MNKKDERIIDLKISRGIIFAFAVMFAVFFFYGLYENSVLQEKIDSALDLSRAYENEFLECEGKQIGYLEIQEMCGLPESNLRGFHHVPPRHEPPLTARLRLWSLR